MKKIAFILLAFLALACNGDWHTNNENWNTNDGDWNTNLSEFLSTRSDEPLKGTIWEHQSGEQYNRYLFFDEADVSLFYGLTEDGELQRWSPFYTGQYLFNFEAKRI